MNAEAESSLGRLIEGNRRYCGEEALQPHRQGHRDDLADNGQRPFACIIGCSDSRAVPETVFHARLGEIFSIRTAGNTVGETTLASAEYAAEHLHIPLIVVMGHTHCGAVDSALKGVGGSDHMGLLMDRVRRSFGGERDPRICERLNAVAGVERLMESPVLREMVAKDELEIVAAVYDIRGGAVEFLEKVRSQHRESAGELVDHRFLLGPYAHTGHCTGFDLGASRILYESCYDALGFGRGFESEEFLFGAHLEGHHLLSPGVPFRENRLMFLNGLQCTGNGRVCHLCGGLALGHLDVRAHEDDYFVFFGTEKAHGRTTPVRD